MATGLPLTDKSRVATLRVKEPNEKILSSVGIANEYQGIPRQFTQFYKSLLEFTHLV